MPANAVWVKIDEATFTQKLQEICARVAGGDGEIVLDLSSVHRISTDSLKAMEQLARTAGEKDSRVALRGVNVDVYKVLKLAKLAARFSFLN